MIILFLNSQYASCFILQRCGKQQQCELQEEVKALRGQLEVAMEHLRRGGEEKTCLQALLEQRVQDGRKSQELLEEKNRELQLMQQEAHHVINNRSCIMQ